MTEKLALGIVVLLGLYSLILGTVSLIFPARAKRFLLEFASSATKHYTELLVRLVVGLALVWHAPYMLHPDAFTLFGWVLLATTACLFLIPWRWHNRFARYAVPPVLQHMMLIGLTSLVLGGLILLAVIRGGAA